MVICSFIVYLILYDLKYDYFVQTFTMAVKTHLTVVGLADRVSYKIGQAIYLSLNYFIRKNDLEYQSAKFFCKGPDSNCVGLRSLWCSCSALALWPPRSHRQYLNKWCVAIKLYIRKQVTN